MTSLFFYGTLRDRRLLEIVLGRSADSIAACPARLPGHAVFWVKDAPFPMIEAVEGQQAEGLLVEGLSQQDLARLNFYEGGFSYDLKPVELEAEVRVESTEVYFPEPGLWPRGEAWSLEAWQARWGPLSHEAALEVMHYFGKRSAEDVSAMFPMIRARAAARVNAASARAENPSGMGRGDVVFAGRNIPYADYFTMEEHHVGFRRFDGSQSPTVKRVVFAATDAVIVLPYDPVRDRVLLIEQFRAGPWARGDGQPWQLEPIAGRLDAGETPETTAHREAMEEAGLELRELHPVANVYASPGCSTEYFYVYLAIADLPDDITGTNGLDSEEEDIRSHLYDFEELMRLVDELKAANAPLVLAGLWLARHRESLRASA